MTSGEKRRGVAEGLRYPAIGHPIHYKGQFPGELAGVAVGFDKPADPIDPEGGDDD